MASPTTNRFCGPEADRLLYQGLFDGQPYYCSDSVNVYKWNAATSQWVLTGGGSLPTPICVTLWQDAALAVWTNMPAALTEFRAVLNTRMKLDLTLASQSRVTVRKGAAASANAKIKVQYSTDESTWYDLCLVALNTTANVTHIGAWTAVPSEAKADVFVRVVGIDGDGVADPSFGLITLQVS